MMKRSLCNLSLLFAGLFFLSGVTVLAQKPAVATKDPTPPTEQDKTRARRVAGTPTTETAAPAERLSPHDESGPDAPAEPVATPEKEDVAPAPQPAAVPQDPILQLRDQIDAAATTQERIRLQFQLVEKFLEHGKKTDAVKELQAMSGEDRFNPQGFYNIGNALARLGETDSAMAAYSKAISQRKGRYSRALNNLGVMQLRQGLWSEAYNSFMSALRIENFRYAEASYNLGRLYAARGENDLAVREWRRAIAVNPEHQGAAQALGGAGTLGQISVASVPRRTQPDRAPLSATLPPAPARSSSKPATATRPAKVERSSAAPSLTVDPDTYEFLQRARTAHERGREEDAITNYRRVISRMGGYFAPANLEMSYSLISLKRNDEAIAILQSVTHNDGPRYPISFYYLARLYEARGDLKLAEENFVRAAATYREDNAQFLLDVSRLREKLGDYQGALAVLEEYLAIMERKNLKPEWSEGRLASLRERVAAQPKP